MNPELDTVLTQADNAFQTWKDTPVADKKEILMNLFRLTEERKDAIADIMVEETGKTKAEALFEMTKFGEFGAKIVAENLDEGVCFLDSMQENEPLGAIFGIMPFNLPAWQVFRYVIPTVMAGNTAIIKPDQVTERSNAEIQKLFDDAGFPKGVISSINTPDGIGAAELSTQAIEDPRVKGVSFTGSSGVGASLEAQCDAVGKPIVFEGGGSDPYIVLPGADLDLAAKEAVFMRLMVNGQVCIACKRLYVHEDIAEEFIPKVLAEMEKQTAEKGGPQRLAKAKFAEDLNRILADAEERGAEITQYGEDVPEEGIFAARVVRLQHDSEAAIFAEETFGPVLPISTFKDVDQALEFANDTPFGLSSAVYGPEDEASSLAAQIESGMTFTNEFTKSDPRKPFTGIKASGNGKDELGPKSFKNFTIPREIALEPGKLQSLTGIEEGAPRNPKPLHPDL